MTKEIKNEWQHYYENDAGHYHGEYKLYRDNGQLAVHCHYENDAYHGEYKDYYKNGQLWCHCHFKNDARHGEYTQYGDDGRLNIHTYEVNDEMVHDFMVEDSELIRTCLYIAHGAPFLGNTDVT